MTHPTAPAFRTLADEAKDVTRRFAAALATRRGETLDDGRGDANGFVIAGLDLCLTSMAGTGNADSIARLDRLVARLGIDGLMVRIFLTSSSKEVAFDALLRSDRRTEVVRNLRLLIDCEGQLWLIPRSPTGQGLMIGRSGLLPVCEASQFRGAEREAGLAAGVRYLAEAPD